MIFPALREAVSDIRESLSSDIIELGLKNVSFSARNVEEYARHGFPMLYSLLGGGEASWSGQNVSHDTAQNHSVVWACERIISESVGFLPLNLMRKKGNARKVAEDHPCQTAVHFAPNEEMAAMTWRETATSHTVMTGNSFALIARRSGLGEAIGFNLLTPDQVLIDREREGAKRLVYVVNRGSADEKTYTVVPGRPHDILHIPGLGFDGTRGYNVVHVARQSIGRALSEEKYAARYFGTGGRQPGYFEMAQRWKDPRDAERFRKDLEDVYGSADSFHKMVILEAGVSFKPGGWSPQDSQFLESRQFTPSEICRWFLMQPHMVGDLARATFNNIEQLALQFVTFTLTAWLKRWEENLWRCVLTPAEKEQGYYFRHNLDGILRGDFMTRMQGYAIGIQNGFLNQNEVRGLEDRDPFEGGDDYHIQLNMQTLPGGTPTASQQAQLDKIGARGKEQP